MNQKSRSGPRPRPFRTGLTLLLSGVMLLLPVGAQELDYAQARALEEFRSGVGAFHNGLYNKAILSLEKALGHKPQDARARAWLGLALYHSGLEAQALNEWEGLIAKGQADEALTAWVDVVKARRGLAREVLQPERYLPLHDLAGRPAGSDKALFLRPTALRPLKNGGYLLVAFGSEEVMEITPNGKLKQVFPGGLGGFSGPYDILPVGDRSFVSEFVGDRISIVNSWGVRIGSFGQKGRKEGDLLGPQYLATDGQALYVTEWGNARVSKFDLEGRFILSFGARVAGFEGLEDPTGIAAGSDRIFVADKGRSRVFAFDTNGNFLQAYGEGVLQQPEGLSLDEDGNLLVADGAKVMLLDPAREDVLPFDREWEQGRRITQAAFDENHDLLVADFDESVVRILSDGTSIYSGLVVRPIRVVTDKYPEIFVEFVVEDRFGRPVVGLDSSNFLISESSALIQKIVLDVQGFARRDLDVSLLVDRSFEAGREREAFAEAVKVLSEGMEKNGGLWIFTAGNTAVPKNQKNASILVNVQEATDPAGLTDRGQFDMALRLAASQLIPGLKKRGVFYLTTGGLPHQAFARYQLSEMARYLKVNGLHFYLIQVGDGPVSPELEYLMAETGGRIYNTREDLRPVFEDLAGQKAGNYVVKYTSVTPPELGRRYIPLRVEVKVFKKTGRGETGFFAP